MFVFPPTNHWASGSSHWSTLLERLEPVQLAGHAAPKGLQVFGRLAAEVFILRHGADAGLGRKIAWRREDPLFFHHVVDLAGSL